MAVESNFTLTICGLHELDGLPVLELPLLGATHVLSILDPDYPEPDALRSCPPERRTTIRFHDEIEPGPGLELPQSEHVAAMLAFGRRLAEEARLGNPVNVVVHCHAGISRSTAAVVSILAQRDPGEDVDAVFASLLELRPQAWPNCLMIAIADELLGYGGQLTAALGRFYARQLTVRPEMGPYMRENGRGREVDLAGVGRETEPRIDRP